LDSKKKATDWQLWKTGQIKLEGQGLKMLPDAKDLPEDFQKKLSTNLPNQILFSFLY
jgi:serine/arginine repetitive matrix protein 2